VGIMSHPHLKLQFFMTDIRQSLLFANFMQDLGWNTEKIDATFVYLRRFPLLGYFAKIPRPKPPFPLIKVNRLIKSNHIFQLRISPFLSSIDKNYSLYRQQFLDFRYKIISSPFNPTTTIHIDLAQSEESIFNNFTEAKRRAVRRAIKNGITVSQLSNIDLFINIRKQQYSPLGFLMVNEMQKLWQNFYPKNAALLLAYQNNKDPDIYSKQKNVAAGYNTPVAGILLLFYDYIAYYWFASSLKIGKKLFAPTILVWEALKLAKKIGYKTFDFEGIYDERFPQAGQSWKGFTKFKEGFGGSKITYLENFNL